MNCLRSPSPAPPRGYALLLVLVLTGLGAMVLAGALNWSSTNARLTDRNNQYVTLVSAAEAATEKVLSHVTRDFQDGGESEVYGRLAAYRAMVPHRGENAYWADFEFHNALGTVDTTFVERLQAESYVDLNSQYSGLRGWASTYRILSNARRTGRGERVTAAVNQDIQVASIPIFQFAIFYGLDLELHSMTTMSIAGRVHSNRDLFTYPSASLTFLNDVTVVGRIITRRKPGDPDYSSRPYAGSISYRAQSDTGVSTLNLPVGTNNSPEAVHAVIEIPPDSESPGSQMGRERYFNKAELVIIVGNTNVTAFSKAPFSNSRTSIPWPEISYLVTTNKTFTDQREDKLVRVTELDVSRLAAWSATNSGMRAVLGGAPVNLVYLADVRTGGASRMNGVRLINGQTLPSRGLTVSTLNPLYVQGHFNQPNNSYLGTTNTTTTRPASLIADAVTALSPAWSDAASSGSYSTRYASSMTLNAAILTGIVETSQTLSIYSGGAHNLCRFLENWSGDTFTCNGSMVVLFPSAIATSPFQQPGDYYYPPARNYSFDLNFMDAAKLPPGTPMLRGVIRNSWSMVNPNTTNIVTGF